MQIINSTINLKDLENDGAAADETPNRADGASSEGLDIMQVLADSIKELNSDGSLSKRDIEALKLLKDVAGRFDESGPTEDSSRDDDADSDDAGPRSGMTSKDFIADLADVAAESGDEFGEREEAMLDQGKRLIEEGASPQQLESFLKRAKDNDSDASDLEAFADGLLDDSSGGGGRDEGLDEGRGKSFMDKVDDALRGSQDGDEGPGERMAREAAESLEGESPEKQQEYLDILNNMISNSDKDHPAGDIDQTNNREGDILKDAAQMIKAAPDEDFESTSSSDRSTGDASTLQALLSAADEDGEISPDELAMLRVAIEEQESRVAA